MTVLGASARMVPECFHSNVYRLRTAHKCVLFHTCQQSTGVTGGTTHMLDRPVTPMMDTVSARNTADMQVLEAAKQATSKVSHAAVKT